MKIDPDSPQVRIPPPLMLLASLLMGGGLHWVYPISIVPDYARQPLAVLFIGGGVGLIIYCALKFKKAQTAIEPWKTTSHIVTSGPYRFTRNPIYLSFILIGLGLAFAINSAWIALMQIPLIFILTKWVIGNEERYLEQKFGSSYIEYKKSVRRWI